MEALSDTIKMNNDDDALELCKKTLLGASSFMALQETLQVSSKSIQAQALEIIEGVRNNRRAELDFVSLAFRGKKIGLGKVRQGAHDTFCVL